MAEPNGTTHPAATKNRAFIQAIFSHRALTFPAAQPLLAAIESAADPARPTAPRDITEDDLKTYVSAANSALSPFDYEFRASRHQVTRERIWVLINTTSDPFTQGATSHSADEIAYVRRMLDAMFDTYNRPRAEIMAVRETQALNLSRPPADASESSSSSTGGGLTATQAGLVLGDMVQEGWFEQSEEGYYSLTPRALMELRSWLVATYNEQDEDDEESEEEEEGGSREERRRHVKIKDCALCEDIVTVGQRCPKMSCHCRMHDFCVRNKFRTQAGREECPICKTPWRNAPAVGEKAAARSTGGNARHETNGARARGSRARQSVVEDEDESDADGASSE